MEGLESDKGRGWAAQTRADVGLWLGCLLAALKVDWKGVFPSSLPSTGQRMPLARPSAKKRVAHNYLAFVDVESPGYLTASSAERSAYLYITLPSHLYLRIKRCRNETDAEGVCDEKIVQSADFYFSQPVTDEARSYRLLKALFFSYLQLLYSEET